MLSEHHDIDHDFPEFHAKLEALVAKDSGFAAQVAEHDELDNKIRELEELGQPISDEEIEKLKYKRTDLKDTIYQRLREV